MVKSYLRYSEGACLGLVCSAGSNVEFDRRGEHAIAAALSSIILWNLRTGARYKTLGERQLRAEVTALRRSPDGKSIGAGYSDGSVRIWNISDGECLVTFHGHKKAVTALAFNRDGTMLASGSKDTDVVVWDVVAEAGRCRLQGHKDAVTDLHFIEDQDRPLILTTSKDTLAKLWELDTHHCVQTLVGHRSELWSLAVTEDGSRVVTAGGDAELRVWGWRVSEPEPEPEQTGAGEPVSQEVGPVRVLHCLGTLQRASRARVVTCRFDTCGAGVLAVQSSDKSVEVFRTRAAQEVAKKLKRKEKRKREKAKRKAGAVAGAPDPDQGAPGDGSDDTGLAIAKPAQEYEQVALLRADSKVRSIALSPKLKKGSSAGSEGDAVTLLMALSNNRLEVHEVKIDPKVPVQGRAIKKSGVHLPGHRSDIRALCLSSDDEMLLSTSHHDMKLWNLRSQECIRTISTGYGLCGMFLPGDRQVVIGTKSGQLELYDLGSSVLLETIDAHAGAIWALAARPEGQMGTTQQICTGSADHDVKFWDVELKLDPEWSTTQKRLTLDCVRTLTMTDDVLAVKYSPDSKLLAISLLDATVKVFYEDSLKFFLSLYGHKLPVMSLDISSDSKMIITGSADKNIKIWGLDFGDCHKSIFAHSDSIMALAFVPGTHYFFSASKDKMIKYWDGDKFEQILTIPGHHGEVWGVCVSKGGAFMVSGSHDRSIRIWDQTQEQVFLEEEREKELEDAFEADLDQESVPEGVGIDTAAKATTTTTTNLKDAERLAEAIDLCETSEHDAKLYQESKAKCEARGEKPPPPPPINPFLLGLTGPKYLLRTLRGIKSAGLEEALLVLPLTQMLILFKYFDRWMRDGLQVELVSRCLFFALRMYHDQLSAARMQGHGALIESLLHHTRARLSKERDTIGFNIAGMRHLSRELQEHDGVRFFDVGEAVAAARERGSQPAHKRKRLL